jgi:cohesin complex subunit SA-1/2
MVSMLLEESSSKELSDLDTTNLVRVLSASVKKAVGEKIVPISEQRKTSLNKAQKVRFIYHSACTELNFIQIGRNRCSLCW